MASNFTKATARRFTKKPSPITVPAITTADPSPALKNIFHEKGLRAEQKVIEHFSRYKLLKQRLKTPFAEIDLLFQKSPQEFLLVEVKTLSHFDFLPNRIGYKQKERLFRAALYLQSRYRVTVEVNWAFVSDRNEVLVIEDVCG